MTELELRKLVVSTFQSYNGTKQGDLKHRDIVDTYNSITSLSKIYKLTYTDPWCAATVSAVSKKLNLTNYLFPECSCSRMIALYQKAGRWEEKDSYIPSIGDLVMYAWGDSANYASTDCTLAPNHVGMVTAVDTANRKLTIIEGNMTKQSVCGYRKLSINGRYIRGFCLPDYKTAAKTYSAPVANATTVANATAASSVQYYQVSLPLLKRGSTGTAVKMLQTLLKQWTYYTDSIDGNFGANTEVALYKFQKFTGLKVDRLCGPATWTMLLTGRNEQ